MTPRQSDVRVVLTEEEATAAMVALEHRRLSGWDGPLAPAGKSAEDKLFALVRERQAEEE
jgi:hypothetical protein